jgi:putative ABC transport system permease protein
MSRWSRIRSWARATIRRSEMEQEMDTELRFHMEAYVTDLVRSGVPREEAMRLSRLEFGGIERTKEECRDARGVSFLETFLQDLKYGARTLRKSPGFTIIAALTLALGIGANTAIFSLVDGILLRPLPYANPQQLVSVKGTYPKGGFVAMREQMRTMDVATYSEDHEFNLTGYGEAVRLPGTLVSAELFSMLGVRPELGRTFYPSEDSAGQDNFVVLSHALWQQRFAGDPAIIGRVIELEGVGRQVVGVLPADFRFPSARAALWLPLHNDARNTAAYWAGDFMPVIGRLHPGTKLEQSRAEIKMFQSRVTKMFPWPMPAKWNADVSVVSLRDGMVADVRGRLLMLLGAVVLVLLIACANVANLTLSRAATREKEIAIRSALGAGRGRIATQLLTESILLAGFGGLLGLVFAKGGLWLLKATLPTDMPRLRDVHLDWRVLVFTGGLAILTGFFFGLVPALQSSRVAPVESLKSGGRGAAISVSQGLRSTLVVAEVAFAVMLALSAGLLIRSFWAISHTNPGFKSEHLLTARITPNESFCEDAGRCLTFYRSVVNQAQASPEFANAALVNTLPLGGRITKRNVDLEEHIAAPGESAPLFWLVVVTPSYFRVMGIRALAGREFNDADEAGSAVAVVTASTARRYWPGENAVGKHMRLLKEKEWRTVVGVIPDVRAFDIQSSEPEWIEGTVYLPYNSSATLEDGRVPAEMTIAVRTNLDGLQAESTLRRVVSGLNQEVPISEMKTMQEVVSEAVATPASTTSLFATFASLALVLGMIGIYGVLAFLVSKRTREIGIRVALGASRQDVLWLVMKEGAKVSFAGIALGLAGAVVVTRLLASELYGVSPMDAATYFSVTGAMAAVTLLACYAPTRRAMRVDPLTALRQD